MNDNDDFRGVRSDDSDADRRVPTVPDPLPRPTPEPLLTGQPPPIVPIAPEAPVQHVHVDPSWRNLVGMARGHERENGPVLLPGDFSSGGSLAHQGRIPAELLSSAANGAAAANDSSLAEPGPAECSRAEPLVPAVAPTVAGEDVGETIVAPEPTITLSRVGEEMFAWLKTLASAAVYATLIVTFGFQVARVEGQSMAPTLENQDRLIVNKLAYRLGQPQVGDIVMLYYPLNPDKSFVKRVIAEEGDQIRIVDGRVYRNDVPLNDDYVPPEYRSHDDWGPEVVPQGYYFVMGDHRNNSSDSRHWRFVPKKYIIGKVQLRWWPLPQARFFHSGQ